MLCSDRWPISSELLAPSQRWQPFINLLSDINITDHQIPTSCVHWPGANDTKHWGWPHRDLENIFCWNLESSRGCVFVFRLDSDRKSPHYFWKIRQGGWESSTIYKQFFIQILLKHRFWISILYSMNERNQEGIQKQKLNFFPRVVWN